MTTFPSPKAEAKGIVYPLNVNKVMLGLELDYTDAPLLRYFEFINQFIKVSRVTCIHVLPEPYPIVSFRDVKPGLPDVSDTAEYDRGMQKMEQELHQLFDKKFMQKVNYSVEIGSPLEKLTRAANEASANMVVIGQKANVDYHMIQAMNVIRMVDANVLVAPEKAAPVLKNILVPVDFSENSINALKAAIGFKHASLMPVRIIAMHVYQMIDFLFPGRAGLTKESGGDIQRKYLQSFNEFLTEKLAHLRSEVEPIVVETNETDVASQLLRQAKAAEADLIIMGAKGHTRLSQLFLGSTTESLLRKNENLPVLVVKQGVNS